MLIYRLGKDKTYQKHFVNRCRDELCNPILLGLVTIQQLIKVQVKVKELRAPVHGGHSAYQQAKSLMLHVK